MRLYRHPNASSLIKSLHPVTYLSIGDGGADAFWITTLKHMRAVQSRVEGNRNYREFRLTMTGTRLVKMPEEVELDDFLALIPRNEWDYMAVPMLHLYGAAQRKKVPRAGQSAYTIIKPAALQAIRMYMARR